MAHIPQIVGALTVLQPFAWAIVTGRKDVENRAWRFPFITPATISVHAARTVVTSPARWVGPAGDWSALPRSAHVGLVVIAAQHEAGDCGGDCSPWAAREGWHWELDKPRQLALPVPAYGQLRIWQPGPAIRAVLEAARYTERD